MITFFESFLPKGFRANQSLSIAYRHSVFTAHLAKVIAQNARLDATKAFLFGIMHDVGKFFVDKTGKYKHPRIGYELLKAEYHDIAKICLTHPFVDFKSARYVLIYCRDDQTEANKLSKLLAQTELDDYVELIQICDKLSSATGYVKLETKFAWYKEKQKIDEECFNSNLEKLNAIKNKFESRIGKSIYDFMTFT